ncbi:hypothetical protein ILUMI_21671 [Ignelater luminosus]|uniref:Glucosidase II subunit alpha n=1 Tax=Ignelater luminosus TaxID=2038154 RepID=A0A8K0CIA9_IGNLU|nr:hypothetical protein ILUMI_21671 [Ignelater luminosus]
MTKETIFLFILILQFLTGVTSRKTCDETFCGKLRKSPEGYPRYNLDLSTIITEDNGIAGDLISHDGLYNLKFTILFEPPLVAFIIANIVDVKGMNPLRNTAADSLKLEKSTNETITVTFGTEKAILYSKPFKIELYSENQLVSVINGNNRLVVQTSPAELVTALDVVFHGVQQAYGIPLHADNLALRTTTDGRTDPYRLYNHNNGQYQLKSTEALHSSMPVLYTHGKGRSSGIFWSDVAHLWVDITHGYDEIETYFMSKTPYIAATLCSRPSIVDVMSVLYVATPNLPPYFALGYHQSRNSYANENEVLSVVDNFNKNNLPLESVWLDTNHTDNGKYFTWDPIRFPNPVRLQNQLALENRFLVVTIGQHIKVEKGYFVHDELSAKRFYIRNPDGSDYVGDSLPGDSSYIDFYNPSALEYYTTLFSLETFKARNLHVFLDLNEPTVFKNGHYENTLPPYLLHSPSIPHHFLHNAFGSTQLIATFEGLLKRQERPFIAARSHSLYDLNAGPQIIEDNFASWEHLEISFPMCLSESLVNINMCGANVGGFAGIPDDELYQRWYQAGAWLPFYRAHFAADVPPREPYMYSEQVKARVRRAMYQRYAHLPVWYTLFWENTIFLTRIIRPLFYHYPHEEATFTIDNELLLGANILVAPILKRDVYLMSVYLPGGENELWYNIDDNFKVFRGIGQRIVYVNLDSVPVFYRGGGIIVRKDIPRLTSAATVKDPYTLYICLNTTNGASGTLYVDDYKTYSFAENKFLYLGFSFSGNTLYGYKIIKDADYDGAAPIEDIVILRPPKNITRVSLNVRSIFYDNLGTIAYSSDRKVLKLSNLSLDLREPFELTFI